MRAATVLTAVGAVVLVVTGVVAGVLLSRDGGGDASPPEAADSTAQGDASAVTNDVIAFFQARTERDPVDFVSYTKLAEAYIRQARETGDISAYQRAQAALSKALEIRPDYANALADLASVRFAVHDFEGALETAKQTYAADPSATQALATIGDAQIALGRYDEGRATYGTLSAAASGPSVLSRQAHLAYLVGDTNGAVDLMKQAVDEAAQGGKSPESVAWYRSQLAELYAGRGDYNDAALWYGESLRGFPAYYPALAGLGGVEAARRNDQQAIDLYERAIAAVPQPAYLAALGDVYARAGNAEAARRQYDTVQFIAQLAAINRVVYNRELALFSADHGIDTTKAVDLTQTELAVRKDTYGYDAAAWALYKDGRAGEAAPLMEKALALGTKDARLLFHAGMIARAVGDGKQARADLKQALEINPHFSVLYEDEARHVLAELNAGKALAQTGG